VWVDGVEYDTEVKAARETGLSVSTIHDALEAGGRMAKGRLILPEPPPGPTREELIALALEETPAAAPGEASPPAWRNPLIRYPPGEGPLRHGLRRWH
jgi:hypothetical protein